MYEESSCPNELKQIKSKILDILTDVEAAIDYPEYDIEEKSNKQILNEAKTISEELEKLEQSFERGKILRDGVSVAIVGKPNAGKSSLLNVLVGEERAIVTDIAGTTRDVLEESINLNGISLNIMDTAGIRETEDIVEKIGVDKAKEYANEADLIVYVMDASRELDKNDYDIIDMIGDKKAVILLNKSDLTTVLSKDMIKSIIDKPIIPISAKEEQGIEEFETILKEMFFQGEISFNDEVYITNIRHKTAISDAYDSLQKVIVSIENDMPEDFYSIDLLDAYESLGSITGETIGEDLVNEIFSKFCMGK